MLHVHNLLLYCYINGNRVICTRSMKTWGIRFIYESFFIWIIPSTCQSHEFVYWVRTTGFIISAYNTLLYVSFILECVCSWHDFLFQVGFINTSVFACVRRLASFYVLAGLFSDNPGPACSDPGARTVVDFLLLIRVRNSNVDHRWTIRSPFFQSLLLGSWVFLLYLMSSFCTIYSCISPCSSYLCASMM